MYKTDADIDADTSGDLSVKLKEALKYLPELGIKGVIQGDFLYSKRDLSVATIKGEKYLTFHPNTIVYALPVKSDGAKAVKKSKIGIVWHTTYKGSTLESMKADEMSKILAPEDVGSALEDYQAAQRRYGIDPFYLPLSRRTWRR